MYETRLGCCLNTVARGVGHEVHEELVDTQKFLPLICHGAEVLVESAALTFFIRLLIVAERCGRECYIFFTKKCHRVYDSLQTT